MHFFFLIYFSNPLHVLNGLAIHHQEVALLYIQHMVFIMHLCLLAISTISVELCYLFYDSVLITRSNLLVFTFI